MDEILKELDDIINRLIKNSATYIEALSKVKQNSLSTYHGELGAAIDKYVSEKIIEMALFQVCKKEMEKYKEDTKTVYLGGKAVQTITTLKNPSDDELLAKVEKHIKGQVKQYPNVILTVSREEKTTGEVGYSIHIDLLKERTNEHH
ncbi:hypothetical protein JDW15_04220 [Aerococcaceae bacterium zg-ZJ1578]|uniref:hypothetical protein n=1 Tax=Aerococcaceae bacterium zg-252 TaxID=2796928 RepID=UPI001A20DFBE|nr:hypothetical protein [Aerococcaceae bacterium zg-1578]